MSQGFERIEKEEEDKVMAIPNEYAPVHLGYGQEHLPGRIVANVSRDPFRSSLVDMNVHSLEPTPEKDVVHGRTFN